MTKISVSPSGLVGDMRSLKNTSLRPSGDQLEAASKPSESAVRFTRSVPSGSMVQISASPSRSLTNETRPFFPGKAASAGAAVRAAGGCGGARTSDAGDYSRMPMIIDVKTGAVSKASLPAKQCQLQCIGPDVSSASPSGLNRSNVINGRTRLARAGRKARHDGKEQFAGQRVQLEIGGRLDHGYAWYPAQQRDLSKRVAGTEPGDQAAVSDDVGRALLDHVAAVSRVALTKDHVASGYADRFECPRELFDRGQRQRLEHGHALQQSDLFVQNSDVAV
jgi:hypothetical protein